MVTRKKYVVAKYRGKPIVSAALLGVTGRKGVYVVTYYAPMESGWDYFTESYLIPFSEVGKLVRELAKHIIEFREKGLGAEAFWTGAQLIFRKHGAEKVILGWEK